MMAGVRTGLVADVADRHDPDRPRVAGPAAGFSHPLVVEGVGRGRGRPCVPLYAAGLESWNFQLNSGLTMVSSPIQPMYWTIASWLIGFIPSPSNSLEKLRFGL